MKGDNYTKRGFPEQPVREKGIFFGDILFVKANLGFGQSTTDMNK